MLIPIGTDNPLRRQPLANYALIFANIAIFLATYRHGKGLVATAGPFILNAQTPHLYQFITYAFLHANWVHVLGNMLFLYIFGNNVNDRLGTIGYLLLYLTGGICSGIGHALTSPSNVLGASGAVAAVTGAYMVLFPMTNIHVIYIIFFIGTTNIPAVYFILFKLIVYDNLIEPQFGGAGNVAYTAHLAGYVFGIVVPLAMLALKILPHSHFDLWAFAQRWRRRQQYRSVVSKGYDAFSGTAPHRVSPFKTKKTSPPHPQAEQITQLRAGISQAVQVSDLTTAADTYLQLLQIDPEQFLPEQQQLDIANKLMQTARYPQAAQAYETFLSRYPKYPYIEQIQLMLGLLYSRYLNEPELAAKYLQEASGKLTDSNQKKMCQDELDRLRSDEDA